MEIGPYEQKDAKFPNMLASLERTNQCNTAPINKRSLCYILITVALTICGCHVAWYDIAVRSFRKDRTIGFSDISSVVLKVNYRATPPLSTCQTTVRYVNLTRVRRMVM